MKILHCCLAAFYIDNFGYQENILPKIHKIQGHEVQIIASTETYLQNKKLGYTFPGEYLNENGIKVIRLPYRKFLFDKLTHKLRMYKGLENHIERFRPDVIFLHDLQFIDTRIIRKYIRKNPHVKLFTDSHTDYINSAKGWISLNILHRLIYRWCARQILDITKKFWATLPIRKTFLEEVYRIPSNKIGLLEFGADDTIFDFSHSDYIRISFRKEMGISEDAFVICSGGKIDKRKNIQIVMEALTQLKDINLVFLVFGTTTNEMSYLLREFKLNDKIKYLGWADQKTVYKVLISSDLGVFPGTHSVLWEQACGVGLPCIFKYWEGITHVDLGGNCIFIENPDPENLAESINWIVESPAEYDRMKNIAMENCIPHFAYSNIARRAISMT